MTGQQGTGRTGGKRGRKKAERVRGLKETGGTHHRGGGSGSEELAGIPVSASFLWGFHQGSGRVLRRYDVIFLMELPDLLMVQIAQGFPYTPQAKCVLSATSSGKTCLRLAGGDRIPSLQGNCI